MHANWAEASGGWLCFFSSQRLCNAIGIGVPNPTLLHWVQVLQLLCLVFVTQLRCKNDCFANGGVGHLHSNLQSNCVAKPLSTLVRETWQPVGRQLRFSS